VGLDANLRPAYLQRLGLEAEPPAVKALTRLHARHVERVACETLSIHAGETWDIDPLGAAERVALRGRGGYCFHLNGAFSELLASLGYEVTRHVGGVHRTDRPEPDLMTNHLVLTVRLATAQRRDATGADVLRGLELTRVGDGATPPEALTDRATWCAALRDVFDLRSDGVEPALLDRLWSRCLATHRKQE
jgi:hypothetical protein